MDRSLALAEQARGPNHHFLAETLRIRGRLRQSRGRCLEAEADFVRALRITEASDPPDPRDLEACLKCLAEHYRQRGEPERGS